MESPRFNDELKLKYIVIHSNYNNRLLGNRNYAKKLYNCINELSAFIADTCDYDEGCVYNVDDNIKIIFKDYDSDDDSDGDDDKPKYTVNIIPDCEHARLLFTKHRGYTWIDKNDADGKIYANGHSDDEIENAMSILNNDYVDGSFVIELYEPYDIEFRYIVSCFITELTKSKYCGCFDLSTMNAKYDNVTNVLYLEFDTESG